MVCGAGAKIMRGPHVGIFSRQNLMETTCNFVLIELLQLVDGSLGGPLLMRGPEQNSP